MATHSSVLAWRIPGMVEPGGLPSMVSHSRTRLKRLSSSSSGYITSNQRLAGGYSFCPLLMPVSELSLSPLYFNKTLSHIHTETHTKKNKCIF